MCFWDSGALGFQVIVACREGSLDMPFHCYHGSALGGGGYELKLEVGVAIHWGIRRFYHVLYTRVSHGLMRHADSAPSVYGNSMLWLSGFASRKVIHCRAFIG